MYSPVSESEVAAAPSSIKTEISWNDDFQTFPHLLNLVDLDSAYPATYPDTQTFTPLTPAEPETFASLFQYAPDFQKFENTPNFLQRMDDNHDYFLNSPKDEGYISLNGSLHSPAPSDSRVINVVNDSSNSNSNSELSDISNRGECAGCGTFLDISAYANNSVGHLMCYSCSMLPPKDETPAEEPVTKRSRKKQSSIANNRNQICKNCDCPNTTLWRRNSAGENVCNACGLYEKLHKRNRPKSMRKDTIQKRRRKPRNADAKKKAVAEAVSVAQISPPNNRAVSQPMVVPSHPPPPYNHRYITIEDSSNYQVLPPMGSLGYLNNYTFENTYGHYSGLSGH